MEEEFALTHRSGGASSQLLLITYCSLLLFANTALLEQCNLRRRERHRALAFIDMGPERPDREVRRSLLENEATLDLQLLAIDNRSPLQLG